MKRGRRPVIDWETVKSAYLASNHSTREISIIFGLNPETVASRAKVDGWVGLRKRAIAPIQAHVDKQISSMVDATNGQKMQKSDPIEENLKTQTAVKLSAEERIAQLKPKQVTFRERIAKQTDRVLDHLESQEIITNMQADQFVTILEKTEKVGSRARGLDKDDEKSSRVLINLSVLNGATETALARALTVETSNLPALES